jgi:CRISPR-associated protein Cmr5
VTREQERAKDAFERVKARVSKDEGWRNEYGGMAHKIPILVRQAGLAQALAFIRSRGKEAHQTLLEDLAHTAARLNAEELITRSREASLTTYLHLTREVLTAALWYKRFAQSLLGVEEGSDE